MELKIFAFIGIVATAVVAATAIVGLCIKSSCNYLESQSRKSQKPKPGAKKR